MSTSQKHLIWVEIDKNALTHNIKTYRRLVGPKVLIAPSVKANAYGHGMVETSKICLQAGADLLCVNALFEAAALRKAGIKKPIYIMGFVMKKELPEVVRLDCHIVVYNRETIVALEKAAAKADKKVSVHLKVETGNNRQGVAMYEALAFAKFIARQPYLKLTGISTHFANIEDTQDSSYARFQLANFRDVLARLEQNRISVPIPHCANSAAAMLFQETHFAMVRPGIAVYGMWPSEEVKAAAEKNNRNVTLKPVLSWRTRIAQIKKAAKGAYIGYGCTYRMSRNGAIAILPVGYYDGYDRGLSNKAHVLIHGKKAPVRGRVCMNMIMVEVTDIPEARVEDTATLLGRDGSEAITAEQLAEFAGTINYEITTRIREGIVRKLKEPPKNYVS